MIDRLVELAQALAVLDLDKGDDAPAPRHQIDLAKGGAHAMGQDAPALEPQPPGRERLGAPSRRLGLLAPRFSHRARP